MKIIKFQPIYLLLMVLLLSCSDKIQFDDTSRENRGNVANLRIPSDQVPPNTFVSNDSRLRGYVFSSEKLRIKQPEMLDREGNILGPDEKLTLNSEYLIKFIAPSEYELFVKAHDGFEVVSQEDLGSQKVLKVKYIDETVEKIYLAVTPIKKRGVSIREKLTPVNFLLPN